MSARRSGPAAAAVLAAALLGGCELPTGDCKDDLRWTVNTRQLTLTAGQTATLTAQALGCGGTRVLSVDLSWRSLEPTIASVGRRDGRVVGVSPGATEVIGSDDRYGDGPRVTVTVTQ